MLLNRGNLEIVALASRDASRYALCGVHVGPAGTTATDGHVLGRLSLPNAVLEDFPPCGVEDTAEAFTPCVIEADAVKAIRAAIPKAKHLPILEHARIDVATSNANGHVRAVTTDATNPPRVLDVRKVQMDFPAVDQVIPDAEAAGLQVSFNAELLVRVLQTAIKAGIGGKSHAVTLTFAKKDPSVAPLKITGQNVDTGQDGVFLVMPMRV